MKFLYVEPDDSRIIPIVLKPRSYDELLAGEFVEYYSGNYYSVSPAKTISLESIPTIRDAILENITTYGFYIESGLASILKTARAIVEYKSYGQIFEPNSKVVYYNSSSGLTYVKKELLENTITTLLLHVYLNKNTFESEFSINSEAIKELWEETKLIFPHGLGADPETTGKPMSTDIISNEIEQ